MKKYLTAEDVRKGQEAAGAVYRRMGDIGTTLACKILDNAMEDCGFKAKLYPIQQDVLDYYLARYCPRRVLLFGRILEEVSPVWVIMYNLTGDVGNVRALKPSEIEYLNNYGREVINGRY
jgi:hypothetical protein